ncbi:ERF family protein [Halocynthiibacter styelae]|uniref:ERF family protein n=1 Tax=Halocynthiibacter styelae TaxID=2761955 RepID=A0A8J7IWX1_9RHOB|nr:ERF family protein [Paenihalocynthiibacter styelae]MBI1493435.1 ERF family protein [Paenihalocynthiibacter styelae]
MNAQVEIITTETTPAPTGMHSALPADPMVSMIERIAVDPDADLDKLERMLVMKERLDKETARKAFNAAFSDCQAQIPQVLRNRSNNQTHSRYADLAAIEAAITPVITSHGLSVRFYPTRSDIEGHMGVDCVVSHAQGHNEEYHADVPADGKGLRGNDNKTATHAFGSTMSYGRRYLLCMIFNIATADDNDGNNQKAMATAINEDQFRHLRDALEASGMPEVKFHTAFNCADPENATLHQFPASRFDEAMDRLSKFKKAREAREAEEAAVMEGETND